MNSRENPNQTRKAAALPTTEHAAAPEDWTSLMTNPTPASIADQVKRSELAEPAPVAGGTAYPPAPGRTRWAIAVRCPLCQCVHMHAVERLPRGPLLKSPGCAPWRTYEVQLAAIDLTGQVTE